MLVDDQPPSPAPVLYEATEEAEEAGSYSPELLHGEETEEAIDPEEDKAILVIFLERSSMLFSSLSTLLVFWAVIEA